MDLCPDHRADRDVFRMRWVGTGMHDQSAAYWADVRHGDYANDFLWLHVLSVERAEDVSDFTKGSADQPLGVRERRDAGDAGSAVFASARRGGPGSAAILRCVVAGCWVAAVWEEDGELANLASDSLPARGQSYR